MYTHPENRLWMKRLRLGPNDVKIELNFHNNSMSSIAQTHKAHAYIQIKIPLDFPLQGQKRLSPSPSPSPASQIKYLTNHNITRQPPPLASTLTLSLNRIHHPQTPHLLNSPSCPQVPVPKSTCEEEPPLYGVTAAARSRDWQVACRA